ncbi:MAG: SDR family NAD(P)-dependent oxidoreductase [Anaerolineales bacterium]|nr:SDR family NAD(P)-dependent oxidoreductase [Anaerolineales bacterium]
MDEKIYIITGANSGIGKAAAIQIAQQGWRVIMACRNLQRGEKARREVQEISGSDKVELMIVDMALQASIREFSAVFLAKYNRLDGLIQNAAIFDITQKQRVETGEGIERVWATNHIGPVLLTELLWEALKNSAQGRVITIASKGLLAKPFLKVDIHDPEFKSRPFSVQNAYYQSKLAQIIYTLWLAEKGKGENITANCIRVPAIPVDVEQKYAGVPEFMKKLYALKTKSAISAEQMAEIYTYLVTAKEVENMTGMYFDEKAKPVKLPRYAQQAQEIEKVMRLTMGYIK